MVNNKIGWIFVIALAVVIVVSGVLIWRAPSANNVSHEEKTEEKIAPTGKAHQVRMKGNEFIPKELTVGVGDEVTFVNEDADAHWPASDIHPTHTLCHGFDSLLPIKKGERYSHVFKKAGNCPMHDHILPSMRGKILVK